MQDIFALWWRGQWLSLEGDRLISIPSSRMLAIPIKKEGTMIMRHTCAYYMLMASGIPLFAGCSFLADKPQGETQLDSTTFATQSKSLAGSYRDLGSDGSIKPHPYASYNMSQEPQPQTSEITLGAPVEMPNMRMGTIKSETGGTTPRSGSGSTGSSGGTRGAGGK